MPVVALQTDERLIDFLKQGKFLSPIQIQEIETEAKKRQKTFEMIFLEKGFLHDADAGKIIADIHGWNFVNLRHEAIEEDVLRLIPESVARAQKTLAFSRTSEGVKVAMNHPEDTQLLHLLQKKVGAPVLPHYVTPRDIAENLYRYQEEIEEEFDKLIRAHANEAAFGSAKDSAVVKLVDLLITHGYKKKASDIHIDPQTDHTVVRFRMDGVLHDIVIIPRNIHDLVITRIKVMCRMHTDEHQAPQDGKIAFDIEEESADIRVSVVPTTKGENVVMRLLSEKSRQLSLEDLGLGDRDFKKLYANIAKPWGMILVTGPTGSGKTTSLYAVLKILNTSEVNIDTIEEPVEYNIEGITQIQVNPKAKLTFASGLRSIVRQDPDIIMVGEIRDEETADIAVNSAMTGHLVLSTLHTNDAATTLPRLLEMGVEPFLIASTVNIIIAQRLVRRICQRCIQSHEADMAQLRDFFPAQVLEKLTSECKIPLLYKGVGCSLCAGTGFAGRVGVFEILEVTDPIRKMIMQNADADQIKKLAIEEGMTTMLDDSIAKVLNGMTTVEEILRVIKT
ncbi:MAG: GspE/PulE family protein [Candidatus Peregrinibacteria bacterium]